MFLPNKHINLYLESENIGFWIDYSYEDKSVGIIVKIPFTAIKGILLNAKVEFHLAIASASSRHLCIGMTIYDIEENPAVYVTTIRDKREVKGLHKLLYGSYDNITLTFYNEFTHPVVWADVKFEDGFLEESKRLVNVGFSTTKSFKNSYEASDSFYKKIIPDFVCNNEYDTQINSSYLKLENIKSILSSVVVPGLSDLSYDLSEGENGSEGYVQEEMIAHALSYLFGDEVLRSPNIKQGDKTRELIDVAVIDSSSVLLIESKASAIIEKGKLVSLPRRNSNTYGLIKKAISQVEGVAKLCKNGVVFFTDGKNGEIMPSQNIHIIIVVSEIIYDDPDSQFNHSTNSIYDDNGCKVQLMDLGMLINFIKLSRMNKVRFWKKLDERFELSYKNLTYNIKDIDSSLPIW